MTVNPQTSMFLVSASQISNFLDCPRKWWFESRLKKRYESNAAQGAGVQLAKELDDYLKGIAPLESLSPLAREGLPWLPTPGEVGFLSEAALNFAPRNTPDVLYTGAIDVLDGRAWPQRVRILDHKRRKNRAYALMPEDLMSDIQLSLYAMWFYQENCIPQNVTPEWEFTHLNYIPSATDPNVGSCFPVSVLVPHEHLLERFMFIQTTVEQMRAYAASVPDDIQHQNAVALNEASCGKYGGCNHASYCTKPPAAALARMFGGNIPGAGSVLPTPSAPLEVATAAFLAPATGIFSGFGAAAQTPTMHTASAIEEAVSGLADLRGHAIQSFPSMTLDDVPGVPVPPEEEEPPSIVPFDAPIPSLTGAPQFGPEVAVIGLPTRLANALRRAGVERLSGLLQFRGNAASLTAFLLTLPGVGEKSITESIPTLLAALDAGPEDVSPAPIPAAAPSPVVAPVLPGKREATPAAGVPVVPKSTVPPSTVTGFDLYVGCQPVRGWHEPIRFGDELVAPYVEEVNNGLGMPYTCAEYGRGYAILAAKIVEKELDNLRGIVVIDTKTALGKVLQEVLQPHARTVVRAFL